MIISIATTGGVTLRGPGYRVEAEKAVMTTNAYTAAQNLDLDFAYPKVTNSHTYMIATEVLSQDRHRQNNGNRSMVLVTPRSAILLRADPQRAAPLWGRGQEIVSFAPRRSTPGLFCVAACGDAQTISIPGARRNLRGLGRGLPKQCSGDPANPPGRCGGQRDFERGLRWQRRVWHASFRTPHTAARFRRSGRLRSSGASPIDGEYRRAMGGYHTIRSGRRRNVSSPISMA